MWNLNEVRQIDGVKVKCVKDDMSKYPCDYCLFYGKLQCEDKENECWRVNRPDNTDVHFEKVEGK